MIASAYSIIVNDDARRYSYHRGGAAPDGWRVVNAPQYEYVERGYIYEPFPPRGSNAAQDAEYS